MTTKYVQQLILVNSKGVEELRSPEFRNSDTSGGMESVKGLTSWYESMWERRYTGEAPMLTWEAEKAMPDGMILRFTRRRTDISTLTTVDGQRVDITHESIMGALYEMANRQPSHVDIPWHMIHSTVLANIGRSLNEFCVNRRDGDGRIPEWLRKNQNTPYV